MPKKRGPRRPSPPSNPLDHLQQMLLDQVQERMDSMLDQFFTSMFPGQARFVSYQPPPPASKPKSSKAPPKAPAPPPAPTLYDILQVSPSASIEVINGAWRSLCKLYHPDIVKGQEKKMKEINRAYDILGDTKKREQYDQHLRNQRWS